MEIIIKTPTQVDGIRKSCKLAAQTLEFLESHIQPGVSTNQLNMLADEFIRRHGAIPAPLNYNGFPKSICTSVNEVICHGIPNQYILKDGDIINIDVTTILDGYYGDTCTMFPVGKISDNAQRLLEIAKKALDIGIRQVRPGNFFGNIGYEIGKYILLQDCTVVEKFTGHGVGLSFHESPHVCHIAPKDSGDIMKVGNIFTIEPMINRGLPDVIIDEQDGWTARTTDGQLSAQYEHTILVIKDGHEILTVI